MARSLSHSRGEPLVVLIHRPADEVRSTSLAFRGGDRWFADQPRHDRRALTMVVVRCTAGPGAPVGPAARTGGAESTSALTRPSARNAAAPGGPGRGALVEIGGDLEIEGRGKNPMTFMRPIKVIQIVAVSCVALMAHMTVPGTARACDLCAIYTAVVVHDDRPGFEIGVAEQYSDFGTLQEGSEEVPNPGERLRSSITQVLLGYNVNRHVGFQLGLPIIARNFRRLEGGVLKHGDESGVGDLALLVNVRPFTRITTRTVFRLSLFGGLKLPSGNPDRLGEEADETHEGAHARLRGGTSAARIGAGSAGHTGGRESESGIHGHDLALGSGSVDGIIGAGVFAGWRRLFLSAHSQYAIRTVGDFDYQYANDLTWSGGPGAFVLLDDRYSVGLQAAIAGETKGKDEHQGEPEGDTGLTAIYMGPRLLVTWGSSLYGDVAGELPVVQHNTGLQIVSDFRVRGGLTWRF